MVTSRGIVQPDSGACRCFSARTAARKSGFTLVELLVTVSIIAVLLSLLLPAIRGSIEAARSAKCRMNLRMIAADFALFADDELYADRGDDPDRLMSDNRFMLSTFVESEYRMDEFSSMTTGQIGPHRELPRSGQFEYLQCPSHRPAEPLRVVRQGPCYQFGFDPAPSISYGFNFRLYRRDASLFGLNQFVVLNSRILSQSNVPLVFDVDWKADAAQGVPDAVFGAPSLGSTGPYLANDKYWNPGKRHSGSMNVAFVDGHVDSTSDPLAETWRWDFEPR